MRIEEMLYRPSGPPGADRPDETTGSLPPGSGRTSVSGLPRQPR